MVPPPGGGGYQLRCAHRTTGMFCQLIPCVSWPTPILPSASTGQSTGMLKLLDVSGGGGLFLCLSNLSSRPQPTANFITAVIIVTAFTNSLLHRTTTITRRRWLNYIAATSDNNDYEAALAGLLRCYVGLRWIALLHCIVIIVIHIKSLQHLHRCSTLCCAASDRWHYNEQKFSFLQTAGCDLVLLTGTGPQRTLLQLPHRSRLHRGTVLFS